MRNVVSVLIKKNECDQGGDTSLGFVPGSSHKFMIAVDLNNMQR